MRVLNRKRQVILLVDNLDKSWTKRSDLTQLADFLLGMLIAASRVGEELSRSGKERMAYASRNTVIRSGSSSCV
jgi:hypothetical protein